MNLSKHIFEQIYTQYNKRAFVHPDPLEFLYKYPKKEDREIVGLIASSLAYGRVSQILKSVKIVLDKIHPSPKRFIEDNPLEDFQEIFHGFKYRFTDGEEIAKLMFAIKNTLKQFGSLEASFKNKYNKNDSNIIPALSAFVDILSANFDNGTTYLLPHPKKGSACKRLMLFLRWMIRKDDVDLGLWQEISPATLVIPLDTHMHKISLKLRLTKSKQGNLKTAIEITNAFKTIAPKDPVKYDFALTRFGIQNNMKDFFKKFPDTI